MRIPLNWLEEFVRLPKSQKDLTDKLTMAGHMLDKVDNLDGNIVLDLELRGNRADCYSIIGIAREVSALFNTPLKKQKENNQTIKKVQKLTTVALNVKTPLVKRVAMNIISEVKIEKSPNWLSKRLNEYGIAPINNIVDLTNYIMIETGQPMHAFDLDKIGSNLEIRLAKTGESMETFLGQKVTLGSDDLVWSNGASVLSIAGAIGGKTHSISDSTKNILIEAANYDRANIRRSIHKHNLLTDAGIRHEKEIDPNMVDQAIFQFMRIVKENSWGKPTHDVSDYYPKPVKSWQIKLNYEYLYSLSGIEIDVKTIKRILESLNIEVTSSDKSGLIAQIPTYRTDVTLEEDLIEEILRIHGYENIPTQTLSLEIPKSSTPKYIDQELEIKNVMLSLGFDEVISSTFVQEKLLNYNQPISVTSSSVVKVENRPSPDNEELRMSLFPNLIMLSQKILNERGSEVCLFELGKTYFKSKNDYSEKRKLGLIYYNTNENGFSHFKGYLEALFLKLNIVNIDYEAVSTSQSHFENCFSITQAKTEIGQGAKFENFYFAEIDLDLILDKKENAKVELWPKYPPQVEDITLSIPEKTKVGDIMKHLPKAQLIDVYKNNYTFRVHYQSLEKTLTDEEVKEIREKVLREIKKNFGAIVKD